MSWIPDPSTRLPLTANTFTYNILPPILLYYATAILVLLPRTLAIRIALWPLTLYAAFRASTTVDLAKGYPDEEYLVFMNHGLVLAMSVLVMLASIWTFESNPYTRTHPTGNVFLDAFDLSFNLRGIGWSWSQGLRVAKETKDTSSLPSFLLSTFFAFLFHFFLFDAFLVIVQSFQGLDSPYGASIFDHTLPPLQRYTRSSLICFFSGLVIYHAIVLIQQLVAFLSLLLLPNGPNNNPTTWPPLFLAPWFTTSLNEFWSTRWHQLFRNIFIAFGGAPFYAILGKFGAVFGAFLSSGILHWLGLWGMGRGTEFLRVAGYFLMMGAGTVLEFVFKLATGKRVGGFLGWMWSMLWILGWGNMLCDAWLVRGLAGSKFMPDAWRPALTLFKLIRSYVDM
ncbi:hypothetical protein CPC08DRAFT_759663 [Agrocybe pediades]|nr:hypothetical protein CPC08DRAFT_759663 [Agrocybe pediades]